MREGYKVKRIKRAETFQGIKKNETECDGKMGGSKERSNAEKIER